MPFPSNSLASSRRSFLVRHTICSCEGKRSGEMGTSINPIQCRTCRQLSDQLWQIVCNCFARYRENDILRYRLISPLSLVFHILERIISL